jgi:hypothetical protein
MVISAVIDIENGTAAGVGSICSVVHAAYTSKNPEQAACPSGSVKLKRAMEGKVKLEDRIVRSIKQRKGVVILRSEVAPLGSTAQVGRVLSKLVADGKLVRVSKGVFAKTRINKFTGKLAPAATFERIAAETFRKLNVRVQPGQLAREYNAGATTQIPMDGVVSTGARRITRKIQVGSRTVKYEKNNGRAVSAIAGEDSEVPSHGLEE